MKEFLMEALAVAIGFIIAQIVYNKFIAKSTWEESYDEE